ncbi:MAG: tRNA pseudouridine(38-40) synthase TruA [Candidatus Omnitrophica bacterium]|jgi:tRNA pseudouridine38-40 synthase|nr:tRNA pseudouridine(38-40) synthase TruA [Candidatus Omnitrophota bacterium]
MRNIRLNIAYDGTNYKGWQIQAKGAGASYPQKTIQHEIETALSGIFTARVKVIGSGRTDAGVHALGQVANFKLNNSMPCNRILRALNSVLPRDIVITSVTDVKESFHSRFDAISKLYRYRIFNCPCAPLFDRLYQYHIPYKINHDLMISASRVLIGRHDFRSFQASGGKKIDPVREIISLSISRRGNVISMYIEADGFLYNMVRNIVGTLVEIGRGKIQPEHIRDILKARDRREAGPTAPAKGLCLMRVKYPKTAARDNRSIKQ